MEELSNDTGGLGLAMADALAIVHWKVKVDAADVEFVPGGSPATHESLRGFDLLEQLPQDSSTNRIKGQSEAATTCMWLLDFNQCQPISMDGDGIDRAVKRFLDNYPYYPRPDGFVESNDERLGNIRIKIFGNQ